MVVIPETLASQWYTDERIATQEAMLPEQMPVSCMLVQQAKPYNRFLRIKLLSRILCKYKLYGK